jgi:hypothetical protein
MGGAIVGADVAATIGSCHEMVGGQWIICPCRLAADPAHELLA